MNIFHQFFLFSFYFLSIVFTNTTTCCKSTYYFDSPFRDKNDTFGYLGQVNSDWHIEDDADNYVGNIDPGRAIVILYFLTS